MQKQDFLKFLKQTYFFNDKIREEIFVCQGQNYVTEFFV